MEAEGWALRKPYVAVEMIFPVWEGTTGPQKLPGGSEDLILTRQRQAMMLLAALRE